MAVCTRIEERIASRTPTSHGTGRVAVDTEEAEDGSEEDENEDKEENEAWDIKGGVCVWVAGLVAGFDDADDADDEALD